jgi:Ca-activated chloride channel family protein
MMKHRQLRNPGGAERALLVAAACALSFAALGISSTGQNQSTQESRARTTASPTPTPQKGTPRLGGAPTPQTPPVLRDAPPDMPDPLGQEIDEGSTVKIDANLVNLQVRVIDRNNRPINDVGDSEFKVYEDGVLQPIEFISREEVPISYGMAVDNSGSMRSQIDKVIEAAKSIVNSNKEGDETFLVRFISNDKIETVQDFTASKSALEEALDTLYIEGGQTAVIDAVYLSAERIGQYKQGETDDRRRRALILITDGEDRNSFYKQDQLFAKLREEDVQIFVIGFVDELDNEGNFIRKSSRERAVSLLDRLAKETGGRAFYPKTLSELPGIANEIIRDLRTQYIVSYNPTNKNRDGSYRGIRVTVADAPGKDKRIALSRNGRRAPTGAAPATPKQPVTRNTQAAPAKNTQQPAGTGTRKSP